MNKWVLSEGQKKDFEMPYLYRNVKEERIHCRSDGKLPYCYDNLQMRMVMSNEF